MFQYKCLNPISEVGLSIFDENYKEVDELNDADAVLVRSAAMHDMQDVPNLLAVARAGAGVNNIPVNDYAEKGIVVFNTPGANANGVKEMVIAGMLLSSRDLIGGNRWVEENKNNPDITKAMEKAKKAFAGTEIQKKKIGVIGLGAIGVLVANVARNLGMDVYGYDPYLSLKSAWNLSRSVHHVNSVDEIFEHCDFISVHVPLMDTTRNMVGREGIAKMKPTATILNFARNGLVDEDAVAEALQEGRLRHYVTDFPTPKVAAVDGVIAFPHLGASTEESEENCAVMAVEQVMDYLENGNIRNFSGYLGATAYSYSRICCRKCGRIIDSVSHHQDLPAFCLLFFNIRSFVLWKNLCIKLIYPCLLGNGSGGPLTVSGHHHDFPDTGFLQSRHNILCFFPKRVFYTDRRSQFSGYCQV